jgi:hypothetical protein
MCQSDPAAVAAPTRASARTCRAAQRGAPRATAGVRRETARGSLEIPRRRCWVPAPGDPLRSGECSRRRSRRRAVRVTPSRRRFDILQTTRCAGKTGARSSHALALACFEKRSHKDEDSAVCKGRGDVCGVKIAQAHRLGHARRLNKLLRTKKSYSRMVSVALACCCGTAARSTSSKNMGRNRSHGSQESFRYWTSINGCNHKIA